MSTIISVIWEQLVAAMHASDTGHELSEQRQELQLIAAHSSKIMNRHSYARIFAAPDKSYQMVLNQSQSRLCSGFVEDAT